MLLFRRWPPPSSSQTRVPSTRNPLPPPLLGGGASRSLHTHIQPYSTYVCYPHSCTQASVTKTDYSHMTAVEWSSEGTNVCIDMGQIQNIPQRMYTHLQGGRTERRTYIHTDKHSCTCRDPHLDSPVVAPSTTKAAAC